MGRKLYAKGEGFNPSTSIEDVEGLREELDALRENGGGGGGDNAAIERRLSEAEGEIDGLQRDVAEQSEEIAAVGAKVNTLQGTDAGKSARTIAAEETAKIVGNAPANYDTLKEIADYISTDAIGAAELSNKVNKNATDIANLDSNKLGKNEQAADSAKLGGQLPDYYSPKEGSWYFNENITAEVGWCTVAKYPTTTPLQPRGKFKFLLVTTGGSYTPLVEEYEGDISWNAENCYFARNIGYSQYTDGIRLVNDGSNTHLQVYFRRAFSGIIYVLYNRFAACTTNQHWQWQSGALVKSDVESGVVGADFGNTNGYSTSRAVKAVEGFVGDLQGTADNSNYAKITGNVETNASFPLLMTNNGSIGTVRYDTIFLGKVNNVKFNPSTGALTAKFIGALQGNADSASKLATARSLWGQSFDGSGDVSEEITISGDGRKVVNVKSKAASDYAGLIAYMSTSSPTSETGGVVFNGSSATYKYGGNALNVFNTRGDIHYEAAVNYHHIFHNELKFTVVADQDLCSGVRTAFKTSIAQIGALIGNHFYLGKEATDKYIRFRKYAGTSNAAPSSITDLMTIDTSGNVVITGTMTATATYHSSDERLKSFEEDVEVDLEKIKALPKKYFHWTADADGKRQLGTSAQAVEEIFPELVSTNADGYKSVNYANLSIIALAAIDKLSEKNAELERRLAKIEKLLNLE